MKDRPSSIGKAVIPDTINAVIKNNVKILILINNFASVFLFIESIILRFKKVLCFTKLKYKEAKTRKEG